MQRISNFRSINPLATRSLRPRSRYAISKAMKRTVVVVACCLTVLTGVRTAYADSASDREMANRYEQAAQAGDDEAQFYLGALYSAGVGRSRSDQEAFRWFSRATDQGHAHAMLIVAGLHASGRGTPKDNVKAYSWAHIVASASKLDEDRNGARQLMSLLMKKMTSDEIGRAVVAARAWRAVRVAGMTRDSVKASNKASIIERAADDQPDPPATAAPSPVPVPAPAAVQPAPAAAPAAAIAQPAPSNVTVLPASPKVSSAAPAKNARRDDVRDLMDQVPTGLRKRFGF
jgi:pyruvate/2-oxoglutarate dehydrogenase complex dihydrolipoamide acyltransferase (E2) component